MLNFLVSKNSWLFKILLVPTLSLAGYNIFMQRSLFYSLYVFLTCCFVFFGFFPWYAKAYRGLGIEDHFEKIMTPSVYILLIISLLRFLGIPTLIAEVIFAVLGILLFAFNLALIKCHLNDKDTLPPSYFGANLYLKAETEK